MQKATRLILLGTKGGPRLTPHYRSHPAQVLLVDDVPYLIDCGYGVANQLVLAGVPLHTLRCVFITHHHLDHNADYGNLLLLAWTSNLSSRVDAYGPPPLARMTELVFELNVYDITIRIDDEGRPDPRNLVHVHEFSDPGTVMKDERVSVTAALVNHPPVEPSFAFRFDTPERSIVISGDTTPSKNLIRLAEGADLLVHEAMYLPGLERLLGMNPQAKRLKEHLLASHATTEEVGEVAAAAGVKAVVLSHLVPGDDPAITDEMWAQGVRKRFSGEVLVGRDLMEL